MVKVSLRVCILFWASADNDLPGYIDPESSGGLEEDLRSRRYPALLADEDYDSDDI